MDESVAAFLRRHPPFDSLEERGVAAVAAAAVAETHRAGSAILDRPLATSDSAYVVRQGAVELLGDGRLLDLIGPGELFGFASILAGEPLGYVARAVEDTLVYRIPAATIRPVLERPAAARFLARALSEPLLAPAAAAPQPAAERRVAELIRAPPLVFPPGTPVQEAARAMVAQGATCVLVELGETLGIVTDRDLRTRVLAEGAPLDTPLADVMSAPARTVSAEHRGSDALLEMLDHGIRHLPVLDARRRLIGVLDDVDLLASEHRAPFRLRALVARAPDVAGVAAAVAGLGPAIVALHDAGVRAPAISRMIAGVHDSATRRLIELAIAEHGAPPAPFTWLALGSFGRREPFPSSDVDCAIAWQGGDDLRTPLQVFAAQVLDGLAACRLHPDANGAIASSALFARSVESWERTTREWIVDPDRNRGLMLLSVVVESAPVWGAPTVADRLARAFAEAPGRDAALRRMAAAALVERPPTGFLRDVVLEPGGRRRGALDIKRRGMLPIESLARWSGLAAGVTTASTDARLAAAEAAGTLEPGDAGRLREAFAFMSALRMEHQVARLRAGQEPDDLIAPSRLTPLTRRSLKEAFRAVVRVQRGIALQLGLSAR